MKKTIKVLGFIALVAVIGILFSGCKEDEEKHKNLRYSIQVNNQATSRSISAGEKVELYIETFQYNEDANPRALILIGNGDVVIGSKGILNNAGWYSVTADLEVQNNANNEGRFSSFMVRITKLKVDNTEYEFPYDDGPRIFGNPSSNWWQHEYEDQLYRENFSGINITDSTVSLKTVLTVEPDIIGTPNSEGYDNQGLADDPYTFIKVEGRINE